jgi:uncharacterized protein (TIGR02271 family)
MDQRQVHEGMDVLDRNGDKIGKAGETLGQYFNVDAGFLGTKEYYVPFDAITEVRENAIWLNVDKHDIDSMGWDQQPSEAEYTGTEYAGGATAGLARGTTRTTEEGETLRLREEELQARKTPVETGRVQLGKDVVEEEKTLEVPVSREEVFVERHPVERRPADQPIGAGESQTIDVPVREERLEVEKQPVVYEEVGVGKRATQETEQVSDTVRREELRMDKDGDVDVQREPGSR